MSEPRTSSHTPNDCAVFTHPSVKNRLRFDLATNGLAMLRVSIEEQVYHLGDLSISGFSYIQEIPNPERHSFLSIQKSIAERRKSCINQQVRASFSFLDQPERTEVHLVGVIKNYAIMPILSLEQISQDTAAILQKYGITLEKDPHHSFEKLGLILKAAELRPLDGDTAQAILHAENISWLNLLIEAGMSEKDLHRLYNHAYNQNHLMMKYGVEFYTASEGMDLIEYTQPSALYTTPADPKNDDFGIA